jgi:hypothetical protein
MSQSEDVSKWMAFEIGINLLKISIYSSGPNTRI